MCGNPACPVFRRPYPPGDHGPGRRRRGPSEYALRLIEKQKLRAIYEVSESAMRRSWERARRSGSAGEELIRQLETRLDTLVLRLGLAGTMRQARQLVSHGHVQVDGRRVDVPNAQVRPGQLIALAPEARELSAVRAAQEQAPPPPPYLEIREAVEAVLTRLPAREEIPLPVPIDDRLIVEYYS